MLEHEPGERVGRGMDQREAALSLTV
jgi:hypothetical protein